MKNISGVEFKSDVSGKAKSVAIDLQKHGEGLRFFLEQVGALSEEENFEKKWSEGISGEELVKRVQTHLRTLPWEKNMTVRI